MTQGWKVDVTGAQDVVTTTADAGGQVQSAASRLSTALGDMVQALGTTTADGAASSFAHDHQDDGHAAVAVVSRALTAASGAMSAFAEGDATMAATTSDAAGGTDGPRG
ncbi:DUF6507 family protein [Curtobacterium sp. Leaf261]|uniref:DUF6507 family protein n=1 Tax=Curtobacterium sp. Leaf261 TaxID=1736311 RepID=UPI0012E27286|nr:DUF6507 family protein [Curtobacterium sp. Leaf261]